MSEEDSAFTIGVGCAAVVVLTPVALVFRGFVLMKLWSWFLVPLGLPAVGMAHALGLAVLASMFVPTNLAKQDDDETTIRRLGRYICTVALEPLLALTLGWAMTFFMN